MDNRRRGMTLLELIVATTLMTVMVAAVAVVLRTGRAAWEARQGDAARITAAHATVRHIVRRLRQAQAVTAISNPGKTSGNLSLLMPSGQTMVWSHSGPAQEVSFGIKKADQLLGQGITELSFVGYQADGITPTTVPAEIHSIQCRVCVELPREAGATRAVSCRAWLRSW